MSLLVPTEHLAARFGAQHQAKRNGEDVTLSGRKRNGGFGTGTLESCHCTASLAPLVAWPHCLSACAPILTTAPLTSSAGYSSPRNRWLAECRAAVGQVWHGYGPLKDHRPSATRQAPLPERGRLEVPPSLTKMKSSAPASPD